MTCVRILCPVQFPHYLGATMTIHTSQRHLALHGAIVLLIGLLCGFPSVVEAAGESNRMWQAAHSALLTLGVWLIATAAIRPLLVLENREGSGLVWSLLITAYSFATAVIIQAITGVRAISPDVSLPNQLAFAANVLAVLGALLSASLTIIGAYAASHAANPGWGLRAESSPEAASH